MTVSSEYVLKMIDKMYASFCLSVFTYLLKFYPSLILLPVLLILRVFHNQISRILNLQHKHEICAILTNRKVKYIYLDAGMFGGVKFHERRKRRGHESKFVLAYDPLINRSAKKYALNRKTQAVPSLTTYQKFSSLTITVLQFITTSKQ